MTKNALLSPNGLIRRGKGDVFIVPRNRKKQYQKLLAKERAQKKEQSLDRKNAFSHHDLTPWEAVEKIIGDNKNMGRTDCS